VTSPEQQRGDEVLAALVAELPAQERIARTRMFSGAGYALGGRIFAFVGRSGRLIAKVEAASAREHLRQGPATDVTMGTRTMREWISLEREHQPAWRALVVEAHEHAGTLPPPEPRRRRAR
jgi:hypothetical protein